MRALSAMIAAFLIVGAAPVAARADAPGPGAAGPGCHCPPVRHHHVWRRHRWRRYVRRLPPPVEAPPLIPVYYNPLLPSPYDTDYDRGMVLHFRSPPVTGIQIWEPGYPATPPIVGVIPYREAAPGTVMQYDGLIGEYVALAQQDAAHALPPPAPPGPATPPPAKP
jgi:hypothetical protein